MKEKEGKNKREWVKTAAIIFLVLMLILTFFSNTIMNYSLPEVATQYVQSGTITAKIRGTGVIESGDPYQIVAEQGRKVQSVAVHVGDKVEKGDILLYLEEQESEELKAAKDALEAANEELKKAQQAYDKMLLAENISVGDINSANNHVAASTYRKQISAKQKEIEDANAAVTPLEEKVAEITQLISDHDTQIAYEQNMNSANKTKLDTAERALQAANEKLAAALQEKNAAENALNGENATVLSEAEIQLLRNTYRDLYEREVEDYSAEVAPPETATGDPAQEASVYNAWLNAVNARQAAIKKLEDVTVSYNTVKTEADTAQSNYNQANQEYEKSNTTPVVANLTKNKHVLELNLYSIQKDLTAAKELVAKKKQELTELVATVGDVMGLQEQLDAISAAKKVVEECQENVDKEEEKITGATVKAAITGTVTDIKVVAGNTYQARDVLVEMQPEGKGYTLSFSVTNEQAKRVSVGDKADLINAWRYDDVTVTLSSIKPDKANPGQMKLLTFDVVGDVVAGQTLNLSVGQKSANFDLIVPNSAVREDSNGKFVLIVESKPSPLSTRYIATRVDVEVIASDETQSAISAALYGYEYVITTSTAPVEAGKQVRLAEN